MTSRHARVLPIAAAASELVPHRDPLTVAGRREEPAGNSAIVTNDLPDAETKLKAAAASAAWISASATVAAGLARFDMVVT